MNRSTAKKAMQLPAVAAWDSEMEARVEAVVDGYADAAQAFAEGLGPAIFEQHGPSLIAAYLQAAAHVHAGEMVAATLSLIAELAAGADRVPPFSIA